MTYQIFAVNAPRFVGTSKRLLLEGASTNLVTWGRMVGAVVFTGTAPVITPIVSGGAITGYTINSPGAGLVSGQVLYTNHASVGTVPTAPTLTISGGQVTAVNGGLGGSGLTGVVQGYVRCGAPPTGGSWPLLFTSTGFLTLATIAGVGTENGLPYIDYRIAGKAGTSAYIQFYGASTGATAGQVFTGSLYSKRVSGTPPTAMALVIYDQPTSAGVSSIAFAPPANPLVTDYRRSVTRTLAASQTGQLFRLNIQSTADFDFVIRLAAFQDEANYVATSPILPPVGTTAASTRNNDTLSYAIPLDRRASGTVVGTFLLPQAAGALANPTLLQVDDGTDTNRLVFYNPGGGALIYCLISSGGATLGTLNTGSMTAGTAFKAALAWDSTGVAVCRAGGAVQTYTGALPPGLANLLVGRQRVNSDRWLTGEVGPLALYSARLSNAQLQALTA